MSNINLVVSEHAFKAMLNRNIRLSEVEEVLTVGEVIADYSTDKPYPSKLFLRFIDGKPLHVVAAWNNTHSEWIVITCYIPDPALWDEEFKRKIK